MTPRPNILGYLVLGGFGVAVAYIALSDDTAGETSGLPDTGRVKHSIDPATGWLTRTFDGRSVTVSDVPSARGYAFEMRTAFAERRKALPSDATGFGDRYSKELYYVPFWVLNQNPAEFTTQKLMQWQTGIPIDEYGRIKPGKYGSTGSLGDVFTNLLANPLMGVVIAGAAVALGPSGIAAYGAYNMWQARGQELTLQNVALTTARAYAVSQCGAPCGIAFDFGVGVASGEDIDTAAEQALYNEMTPEQQAIYEQGKAKYKELS